MWDLGAPEMWLMWPSNWLLIWIISCCMAIPSLGLESPAGQWGRAGLKSLTPTTWMWGNSQRWHEMWLDKRRWNFAPLPYLKMMGRLGNDSTQKTQRGESKGKGRNILGELPLNHGSSHAPLQTPKLWVDKLQPCRRDYSGKSGAGRILQMTADSL